MRHGVGRVLVATIDLLQREVLQHVVHQRRAAPAGGQHQLHPGTQDAGFGDAALGRGRLATIRETVLELVDHDVGIVHRVEEVIVAVDQHGGVGTEGELVHLTHEVVVTVVGTGGVHVIAGEVEASAERSVDGTTFLATNIGDQPSVGGHHSSFAVFICIIEILRKQDTLLRDLETVCTAGRDESRNKDKDSGNQYFFHINHAKLVRT